MRRLVAERCLAGVDANPVAVQLARLSMWLTTLAHGSPLTFLDHRLRIRKQSHRRDARRPRPDAGSRPSTRSRAACRSSRLTDSSSRCATSCARLADLACTPGRRPLPMSAQRNRSGNGSPSASSPLAPVAPRRRCLVRAVVSGRRNAAGFACGAAGVDRCGRPSRWHAAGGPPVAARVTGADASRRHLVLPLVARVQRRLL